MALSAAPGHRLSLALAFERALQDDGLQGALRLLNARTPYRLTGVYRFDGDLVRSVVLFDRKNPQLSIGGDVPWRDSYCRMTAEDGARCEIVDALEDPRLTTHNARAAVQAYVAVLLKTSDGAPLGTLCHYDLHPVIPPPTVFEELAAVRPAVERALWAVLKVRQAASDLLADAATIGLPSLPRLSAPAPSTTIG